MDILLEAVIITVILFWCIILMFNFNWLKKHYKKYRCRHIVELTLDYSTFDNHYKWLENNIDKNKWTIEYPFRSTYWEDEIDEFYIFRFKTKEDLIAFKLGSL